MNRIQIAMAASMTVFMVGLASYLAWPATTYAPLTVAAIISIIAVLWWQAWQMRNNHAVRDVILANAAVASAVFLLMADELRTLADELVACCK